MKYLYITLGIVFTFVGAIGVILPVLPTVPFLLLASFLFAKWSKKLHDYFKSTKIYKNNLESFEKNRSMTLKIKLYILIPVSLMLLTAFCMMSNKIGKISTIIIMIIKYYYFIFKIKTMHQSSANYNSKNHN